MSSDPSPKIAVAKAEVVDKKQPEISKKKVTAEQTDDTVKEAHKEAKKKLLEKETEIKLQMREERCHGKGKRNK